MPSEEAKVLQSYNGQLSYYV